MNLSNMIKELIEPKDLLLSHRIQSCSYKLDRKSLSELLRENPKIVKTYARKEIMEEGCLSYPNLFLKVERPYSIVAKWEDENEVIHKTKFEGFSARIFLHEYDHMEGIDFTQRKVNDF